VNISTIIRAWKDQEYRLGLTAEERSLLPDNPAGLLELNEAELAQIAGGGRKKRRRRRKKGSGSGSGGGSRSRSGS
jgi:mersacidin/lichenicidin family type 2 lantibiotic